MKEAYQKAVQVVKQLQRQRKKWIGEQGRDQEELACLIAEKEAIEEKIAAKYEEIEGENLVQLLKYDQLIRDAEASRDRLLA